MKTCYPHAHPFATAVFLLAIVTPLAATGQTNQANNLTDTAQPRKGETFAPPLSADPPAAYKDLPSFGSITWDTRRLPWVDEGPDSGISGMAMAVHDGKIYAVGGFIPNYDKTEDQVWDIYKSDGRIWRVSRWTWVFDPADNSWERLPDAPFRREYTRGIVAADTFYLVGGANQYKGLNPPYRPHNDCIALDLAGASPSWRLHSKLNVPRTHTSVGSVGDFLVVAGGNEYDYEERGYSHRTIRKTTEVFDLSQPDLGWQLRTPIPSVGRGWCASLAAGQYVYMFGGATWNEEGPIGTRETLRYNPGTDKWQELTPPPGAISGWEGDLYDNRYAILAGGVLRPEQDPSIPYVWSDLVWAYDTLSDKWLRVEGILPPGAVFNDPGVVVIGDTIYVTGAEGPDGSHYNYFLVGHINATMP